MKFVSDLRQVGNIPRVTFLVNQLKTIRTCSLGTLALPKRDKNGTSFQTKTSEYNTNLFPGNTCSEKKQLKTVEASIMRTGAPTKTSKDNTNVQPKRQDNDGTSFQQQNRCSDKNQSQTMKRHQKNDFLNFLLQFLIIKKNLNFLLN